MRPQLFTLTFDAPICLAFFAFFFSIAAFVAFRWLPFARALKAAFVASLTIGKSALHCTANLIWVSAGSTLIPTTSTLRSERERETSASPNR